MPIDYRALVAERAKHVMDVMEQRCTLKEMARIRAAYEQARNAHAPQSRKSGEPYILHPIAVATIAAEEMQLDANAVMAAFLHDVVEDTAWHVEDIRNRFGDDVAWLVRMVTKKDGKKYELSRQLDNYRQLLASMRKDIRAVLVKLADRLHNMRTLGSMPPHKQMKIAGETDYFYAPLANRLGLYQLKMELENLSFRYRCPDEYDNLSRLIEAHVKANRDKLERFRCQIAETLDKAGIKAEVRIDYRRPYSLWRKMKKHGEDFNHLKYRHFVEVIYEHDKDSPVSEKQLAMQIYCLLTDRFKEKHNSMCNYIDAPKENGYQSIHVKLLPDFGRWQEVHIGSRRMSLHSQLGCLADGPDDNIKRWIDKFRQVLKDVMASGRLDSQYMEDVIASFYNDDIQVFTPDGKSILLPQGSTAIDLAYEVHTDIGDHARYAMVNGRLQPMTVPLRRGDVVEIHTEPTSHPDEDWADYAHTYKARKALRHYYDSLPVSPLLRCQHCSPIPGEDTIGIRDRATGRITVHRRDCKEAITLASSYGDSVVSVECPSDGTLYPVSLSVKAVDRYGLFIELAQCITDKLGLSINSFNTESERAIVTCRITLGVHTHDELRGLIRDLSAINGVDEVKHLS